MNIKNIDERGVAYGSFLEICCRKCGEIPRFIQVYDKEDTTKFENSFPNDWFVEIDTNEKRISNVICPKCSRFLKLKKVKNVLERNKR